MNTNFKGRLIQFVEALDFGDAVSNQVIQLDLLFRRLGLESLICSKWHHEAVSKHRVNLEDAQPNDADVIVVHYAGYSEYTIPFVEKLRCTKILCYHNITPHSFFDPSTELYRFCLDGRKQLAEIIAHFHYFWGDSQYNLDELIALGASPEKSAVIPIIVQSRDPRQAEAQVGKLSKWIFLGRIAPNKGQVSLVELFSEVRAIDVSLAHSLHIVGGYREGDPYYSDLNKRIDELGLRSSVMITGKVSDEEVHAYLSKASIYVSMSMHEGFGVPLIEASNYNLPVLALNSSSVAETLGNGQGVADSINQLRQLIIKAGTDQNFRQVLIREQKCNAERFLAFEVYRRLKDTLDSIIPSENHFKTVSIVVCTYNRADYLERCINYLLHQTSSQFEVVVINGPSTDNTEGVIARHFGKIKVGRNQSRNLSVSRNLGIELASGDLVAFIDDDAIPFDDWVATLLHEFNSRPLTLAAIGGPAYYAGTLDFQSEDIGFNRFAEASINIDSRLIGTNGWERSLLGTNTCFRRDVLIRESGFDEQFDYFLDESELCYRLQLHGHIVGYCGELYLRHEFAQSENRGGKYSFNWFSICKNTAYFISAYSGLKGAELLSYVEDRMQRERVQPLRVALETGDISSDEYSKCTKDIYSGLQQGLLDATSYPRVRQLVSAQEPFLPFPRSFAHPLVGVDLQRLHICIITKEFAGFSQARGGIGTLYYHLASELLLMGHHVTVITPGDRDDLYRRGRLTIRFTSVRTVCANEPTAKGFSANISWSVSALHTLAIAHLEQEVDVVEGALWDAEALAVTLLPKNGRPPVVTRLVTPYSVAGRINKWDLSTRDSELLLASELSLIEGSDAVVAISEAIAATIESEHGLKCDHRWRVSHCGIAYWPFFDFRTNYADGEIGAIVGRPVLADKKIVLFVGRLEARKGLDVLIGACQIFLQSCEDACLVLAGRDIEGWAARAQSILKSEVFDRVYFLGEVEDSVRERLLHSAYCVVFPSRYESFGLVPLESFVHGVPVIGANTGAIPEVVIDGECGLLFEPDNANSLADCVERLLHNPDLRQLLADGTREQIRKFSSRASATRAVVMYDELCQAQKS